MGVSRVKRPTVVHPFRRFERRGKRSAFIALPYSIKPGAIIPPRLLSVKPALARRLVIVFFPVDKEAARCYKSPRISGAGNVFRSVAVGNEMNR